MTLQPVNDTPRTLWREQAGQWLNFMPLEAPGAPFEASHDDPDNDPPPAAPALRPWPRVFPGL